MTGFRKFIKISLPLLCFFLILSGATAQNPIDLVEDTSIKLIFGGDVMLGRAVQTNTLLGQFDPFVELTPIFSQYDLAIVNLESVISDKGYPRPGKGYTFRADPQMMDFLVNSGVDAVSLANNHGADYGEDAFVDTMNRLSTAGVHFFGGGLNKATAYQPYLAFMGDTVIAVIGVNFVETFYFAAQDNRVGNAWYDEAYLRQVIQQTEAIADITIIMPHWGLEYTPSLDPRQTTAAQMMIDAGADLIIGAHPHHIQPLQTYKGVEIYYSMGNLIFDGPGPNRGWYLGELVEVIIENGTISSTRAIPYEVDVYGVPHFD